MAILDIAQIGHPVLREQARAVAADELADPRWQSFIDDLIATMHDADGAGIAANQVHTPVRICVLEVLPNNPRYPYKPAIPLTVAVNPIVTPIGEETFLNYEGCLSVPNLRGLVERHRRVHVRYRDRDGGVHELEARGLAAATWQHEVDHLDGVLFIDRVQDPTTLTNLENFETHHREAFLESIGDFLGL